MLIAAVLLLGGAFAGGRALLAKDPAPVSADLPNIATQTPDSGLSNTSPRVTSTKQPPADPTADSRAEAFAQLEALVAKDAKRPTVRGQWVAQLSSKSEGTVDQALQPNPFTLEDILAEHLRLRHDRVFGSLVHVVHLGDWGRIPAPASPMWVTVADISAKSVTEVNTWCQLHFTQRGKALENVCLPRQLTLKSG